MQCIFSVWGASQVYYEVSQTCPLREALRARGSKLNNDGRSTVSDLVDLTWRMYPAVALMAFGAGMALWGLYLEIHGLRRSLRGDHAKIVTWIQGFRLSIVELAIGQVERADGGKVR